MVQWIKAQWEEAGVETVVANISTMSTRDALRRQEISDQRKYEHLPLPRKISKKTPKFPKKYLKLD